MHSAILNGLSCRYLLNPTGLMCNLGPRLIFCLHDLSTDVGEVVKFPTGIVLLSVSSFTFVNIYFIYLGTPMLGGMYVKEHYILFLY